MSTNPVDKAAANGAVDPGTGGLPPSATPNLSDLDSAPKPADWRAQRNESKGRVTVMGTSGEPPPDKKKKGFMGKKPALKKNAHMTSESTLMDLDDSHIPDGATPFEHAMHARIKAMDRDGDGKITIQERPPLSPSMRLASLATHYVDGNSTPLPVALAGTD